MPNPKTLLLVEGINDQSFYKQICRALNLETKIAIAPPKLIGGTFNSKQGAINHLPALLQQMADGQLERLGLIVDADAVADGGGFGNTVAQVSSALVEFGYVTAPTRLPTGGLLFGHKDGLADFGLWVMPNNRDDGVLEDWILRSVRGDEQPLLVHAQSVVGKLAAPKFSPVRRVKAEIATWLAWQDRPGEGLYYAVEGKLLDEAALLYAGIALWLARVFR